MDLAGPPTPLPEWFTEEDLDAYAELYEKSGFCYPLQMPYRAVQKIPNRMDAGLQVLVFTIKDYGLRFPWFEAAMKSDAMETFAPDLKITYIPEGSRFVQEQFPEKVNELLGFFQGTPRPAA